MSGFEEIGFGQNDDQLGSKSKKFKGKEGETYRLSLAWWPGVEDGKPDLTAKTPKFIAVKRLYLEGVGYFLDKGPEYVKIAGGEAARTQVATIAIVWPTDAKGQVDKARFQERKFSVQTWIMSAEKYRQLEQTHAEWPLGEHDLTVACTDTKFQKMNFSPARQNLLKMLMDKDPEHVKIILSDVMSAIATIRTDMAQDLTIEQIRAKLAGGTTGPGNRAGGGGGGTATSAKDLDNMLDDLIT